MATPSAQGATSRFTEKLGPLPVWAWAAGILVAGFLAYRFFGAGGSSSSSSSDTSSPSSSSDTSSSDSSSDPTSGNPGPSAAGTTPPDVGSANDEILSQLAGYGDSIDSLTQAVLTSPAFSPGTGDAGAGSTTPLTGYTPSPSSPGQRAVAPVQQPVVTTHTAKKPKRTATPAQVAKTRPRAKVKK